MKNPVDVHLGKMLHVFAGSIPVLAFASSQSVSKPRTHSVAWVSMTLVEARIWNEECVHLDEGKKKRLPS